MTGKQRRRLNWLKATKKQRRTEWLILRIWELAGPAKPLTYTVLHSNEESLAWILKRQRTRK